MHYKALIGNAEFPVLRIFPDSDGNPKMVKVKTDSGFGEYFYSANEVTLIEVDEEES